MSPAWGGGGGGGGKEETLRLKNLREMCFFM